MKKIFAFMAVAVLAFSFASCNKKDDPAKVSFEISVSEITATGATVAVVASDTTTTYYWDVFTAEAAAELKTKEDVAASFKEVFDYYIENYPTYFSSYADFVVKGEDGYAYSSLSANTEYVVLCVALDENCAAASEVTRKEFKTEDVVKTGEETITLTDGELSDHTADYGWWQLMIADADTTVYLSISPLEATELEGTWTTADMDADYTFIYVAEDDENYEFTSFDATTVVDDGIFTLTGKGLALNGIEYTLNLSAPVEELASGAPLKVARRFGAANARFGKKTFVVK